MRKNFRVKRKGNKLCITIKEDKATVTIELSIPDETAAFLEAILREVQAP